jgi:glycosyltransferase involved in cell wall biosynthesis
MPSISLIIAVYKNTSALNLIFGGLAAQSFKDFEVIVAEDNDDPLMTQFLETARGIYDFEIRHVQQADQGFQKNKALNKSIAICLADYIVFLDGDCIPHEHYLRSHFENRQDNVILFGRRVMLSPIITKALYSGKVKFPLSIFALVKYRCARLKYAFYLPFRRSSLISRPSIWGCNWSIYKKDLASVNGFDEDFIKPGIGEDTDVERRLLKSGMKIKSVKNSAIQYHLHHEVVYSNTKENENLMSLKAAQDPIFCKSGLDQYL